MFYASQSLFDLDNPPSQWPRWDDANAPWDSNEGMWQSGRDSDFFSPPGFPGPGATPWALGQELLLHDSGELTAASAAAPPTPIAVGTGSPALAPTLVGHAGGLQFNLIWDSSVVNCGRSRDRASRIAVLMGSSFVFVSTSPEGAILGQQVSDRFLGERGTGHRQ